MTREQRIPDCGDERDWEGREVPMEQEAADNAGMIRVWIVSPHPMTTQFDDMVVRGWQRMLRIVRDNLDTFLERDDEGTFHSGEKVTLSFSLHWFPLDEYLALEPTP